MEKLDSPALVAALQTLEGWTLAGEKTIVRSLHFKTFRDAFGFMTQIALAAEKANHHPDWSNSYNRVDIALSTHDAGGITQKDIDLARIINACAASAR